MLTLDVDPGSHIDEVCVTASAMADQHDEDVTFTFNNTVVIAHPGESWRDLESRWQKDMTAAAEAYRNSDEYKERERQRAEEYRRKCEARMVETAATEAAMREAKVPWPYTKEQLHEYIDSLVEREHDYGTCVYAMSMAATAALNYVAHKLGTTGFQASCADLDILRRTRSMEGPFILLKAEDALYPQYDIPGQLREAMDKWGPWLQEQAQKRLQKNSGIVHPNVLAHWKNLANEAKGVK